MGLLDALLSGMTGSSASGGAAGGSPLLQILMQLLANSGQGGAGGAADPLSALLNQFREAGLGGHADSWVSSGQNLPISPEQLMQVFGRGQLEQLAGQSGMDLSQLSGGLADMLPQFIDQMTPAGELPSPSGIEGALADLSRMMPRG